MQCGHHGQDVRGGWRFPAHPHRGSARGPRPGQRGAPAHPALRQAPRRGGLRLQQARPGLGAREHAALVQGSCVQAAARGHPRGSGQHASAAHLGEGRPAPGPAPAARGPPLGVQSARRRPRPGPQAGSPRRDGEGPGAAALGAPGHRDLPQERAGLPRRSVDPGAWPERPAEHGGPGPRRAAATPGSALCPGRRGPVGAGGAWPRHAALARAPGRRRGR